MKTKKDIVNNWLPRYTGEKLENFGEYILLTNFSNYVDMFAEWNAVKIIGIDKPMQCATANNITIINFGMGSPTAATVMDLLSAIEPKAALGCVALSKSITVAAVGLPIPKFIMVILFAVAHCIGLSIPIIFTAFHSENIFT